MNEPGSDAPVAVPPAGAPHSARRVLRSTVLSALAAGVILVVFVLPAEYGIDVTGIGRVIGLTEMGETKARLLREAQAHDAEEAAAQEAPAPAQPPVGGASTDTSDTTRSVSDQNPNERTLR